VAVAVFDEMFRIKSRKADAWHNKDVALKRLGRDTETRLAFTAAVWIGPSGQA
jgi:Flp pilus assembly protein TadD